MVDRGLNYRGYHASRHFSNLTHKCAEERTCQEAIFADPRCPEELLAQRNVAAANILLLWSYVALAQNETALGHAFLREAVGLNPDLIVGEPCKLTQFLMMYGLDEDDVDHEALLERVFKQFPAELVMLKGQWRWAAEQGHLLKGIRAMLWGDEETGRCHFARAAERTSHIAPFTIQALTTQLIDHEHEFGGAATNAALTKVTQLLDQVGSQKGLRLLQGDYALNRAFRSYGAGRYREARGDLFRAIRYLPRHLRNRGVWSLFMRSSWKMWRGAERAQLPFSQ